MRAALGLMLCLLFSEAKLYVFNAEEKYEPNWESLDRRPLPEWYDEAKFGIFIHWGVFSVPAFGSEWFWYNWQSRGKQAYVDFMTNNYPPKFTYQDFGKDFTAEFYDPDDWVELFKKAGARYIVLTSKHHEGYTLWPSKHSFSWNAQDVGPRRNLLGDLAAAVRRDTELKFGLYHSLYEWFNPLYLEDKENNFTTRNFVRTKTLPELYDLVNTYRPEVIWSDGDWEATDDYWASKEFLAWLYNDSPVKDTVVANDRWGRGTMCKHGGFYTCQDRYNPGVLQPYKWENCLTIDKESWGFRRNANLSRYMTIEEIIKQLVETVSCGGNYLLNVGPTKEGIITPIFQERLIQLGEWLAVNGEAIYGTKPWAIQKDSKTPGVWYTKKGMSVYAISLKWPSDGFLVLGSIKVDENTNVSLLGYDGEIKPQQYYDSISIQFPASEKIASKWAYVLKFSCCY